MGGTGTAFGSHEATIAGTSPDGVFHLRAPRYGGLLPSEPPDLIRGERRRVAIRQRRERGTADAPAFCLSRIVAWVVTGYKAE